VGADYKTTSFFRPGQRQIREQVGNAVGRDFVSNIFVGADSRPRQFFVVVNVRFGIYIIIIKQFIIKQLSMKHNNDKKTMMNSDDSNDGPRRSERVAKRNDDRKKAREKAREKARDEEIERIVRVLLTEELAHLVTTSHLSFSRRNNRRRLLKVLADEVKKLWYTRMGELSKIMGGDMGGAHHTGVANKYSFGVLDLTTARQPASLVLDLRFNQEQVGNAVGEDFVSNIFSGADDKTTSVFRPGQRQIREQVGNAVGEDFLGLKMIANVFFQIPANA
jgi:hypothetical protein